MTRSCDQPDPEIDIVVCTMPRHTWDSLKTEMWDYVDTDSIKQVDSDEAHIVEIEEETFAVAHPLKERLDGSLFDCGLTWALTNLVSPMPVGRYRVSWDGQTYQILSKEQ